MNNHSMNFDGIEYEYLNGEYFLKTSTVGANTAFGELALIYPNFIRNATVKIDKPSSLITIDRENF